MSAMTPYAAAKVVNGTLLELGIEKVIPPQMMYNYTTARIARGKAPFIEVDTDGRITDEALATWLAKYVAKLQAKVTTATATA